MTAVWTSPRTWVTNELVTAPLMNAHIRDNMDYLYTRPRVVNNTNSAADVSTTSTTFADVDGTGSEFTINITTSGGRLLVGFAGTMSAGSGSTSYRGYLDVEIDGVRLGGDDGLLNFYYPFAGVVSFVAMTNVLSVASHTVKLQWKSSNAANTLTCYMGAGTLNHDLHPQFWALEV